MTQTTLGGPETPPQNSAVNWTDETTTYDDLTVKPLAEAASFGDKLTGPMIRSGDTAWICESPKVAQDWVDEHKQMTFSLPETYGEIREFDPYIAIWDGTSNTGVGDGITADVLEAAVRAVTGGGRYSAEEFTIHPCRVPGEDDRWVLETPHGYLLVHYDYQTEYPENPRRTPSETFSTPYGEVEIMDEAEYVVKGMEHVATALYETYGIELTENIERPQETGSQTHVFKTADGKTLELDARELARVGDSDRFSHRREDLHLWGGTTVVAGDESSLGTMCAVPKPRPKGDYPYELELEVTDDDLPDAPGSTSGSLEEVRRSSVVLGYTEQISAATVFEAGEIHVMADYHRYTLRVRDHGDWYDVNVRRSYKVTRGDERYIYPVSGDIQSDPKPETEVPSLDRDDDRVE